MSIVKIVGPDTWKDLEDNDEVEETGDDYLDDDDNGVKTLATIVSNPVLSLSIRQDVRKPLAKSNFTDPNIYLKLDPIKSIQSQIARSLNYHHVIITRFSYRFRKDMPIGHLFDEKRLLRRFQLFESFCLPSILSQINPNFYWIIVVD